MSGIHSSYSSRLVACSGIPVARSWQTTWALLFSGIALDADWCPRKTGCALSRYFFSPTLVQQYSLYLSLLILPTCWSKMWQTCLVHLSSLVGLRSFTLQWVLRFLFFSIANAICGGYWSLFAPIIPCGWTNMNVCSANNGKDSLHAKQNARRVWWFFCKWF